MSPPAPHSLKILWLLVAVAILGGCSSGPRTRPVAAAPTASAPPLLPLAPTVRWNRIGTSVQGRPLLAAESGTGPLRIYVIGGIHGDETEGRSALETMKDRPHAGATIRILRDLNPDGTAAFRRGNARGHDLNRNWPASNFQPGPHGGPSPLSEPETRALHQDLRAFKPDVVVVLHSIATGPLVNYDGPAERLASAFAAAARSAGPGWHVRPDMGYPTHGSLGSYLGIDRGIPILTVEFARAHDERTAAAALHNGLRAVVGAADFASR